MRIELMNISVNKRHLLLTVLIVVLPFLAYATAPMSEAFIVLSSISGVRDTLRAGESASISLEAPLEVYFYAGMKGVTTGTQVYPEWRVNRTYMDGTSQVTQKYLLRQEADASYTINDCGTFLVKFAYSYRLAEAENTTDGDDIDPISFSIDDSEMKIPNAFSPNGDGINDVFKVKVHSIVSFRMSIFNRWGQLIKSGTQDDLEYEGDNSGGYYICWDGTRDGKIVDDGVYFIRIEAVGAGGKKYHEKSDINVLKGTGTVE